MHSWPALRRCLGIALVVGTVLSLINDGDAILRGGLSGADAARIPLNDVVPFVVSSLGYISAGLPPTPGPAVCAIPASPRLTLTSDAMTEA